ncbi:MAG TPA: PspA/IM30 family protein [Candidatus Competibacteraceae bacterium]|nr:PspA/IM30 family protein [Candidatus Competibacteraceae bacterium]
MPYLLQRLHILCKAQLHHRLDQLEDPELLLKQGVRELHEQVRRFRVAAVEALAWEKRLGAQREDIGKRIRQWQVRAEQALRQNDDELARQALARRLELERSIEEIAADLAKARRTSERLRSQLEELEQRWRRACQEQARLAARRRLAVARRALHATQLELAEDGSVDLPYAMERMIAQVEELEARAEALAALDSGEDSLESRLDGQAEHSRVEEELAALKRRLADADCA